LTGTSITSYKKHKRGKKENSTIIERKNGRVVPIKITNCFRPTQNNSTPFKLQKGPPPGTMMGGSNSLEPRERKGGHREKVTLGQKGKTLKTIAYVERD